MRYVCVWFVVMLGACNPVFDLRETGLHPDAPPPPDETPAPEPTDDGGGGGGGPGGEGPPGQQNALPFRREL